MVFLKVDIKEIIKVCKVHGELTKDKVCYRKLRNTYICSFCNRNNLSNWRKKNKDKTRNYSKKGYEKNKKKIIERQKNYKKTEKARSFIKNIIENLSNSYIKNILKYNGFKKEKISIELIELKRANIQLKRLIREKLKE